MYRRLIIGLAASIGLAAWTNVAAAALFSKTEPVIAIMANNLFVGEAKGHLSGAGTIAIHSQKHPEITCLGHFTSSAKKGGKGKMQCSNGAIGSFHFTRLTLVKGYRAGSYRKRSMSFTYGLTADESVRYLKLPSGKKLEHKGTTLVLADAVPPARKRVKAKPPNRLRRKQQSRT